MTIQKGKKKPSIETCPDEVQMLELLDKDFKWAILNMFKELKENMSKNFKESMRISHQTDIITKDMLIIF